MAALLQTLPWEIIEHIFSFVSAEDLARLCRVCRYFHRSIRSCNSLWKAQCRTVWLLERLDDGCSKWYEAWLKMCEEFGQYRSCYAEVKQAWTIIEDFVGQHQPSGNDHRHGNLSQSLKGGISEQEIAAAEAELGFRLPLDLRCSLRFHDGQHAHNPASFLGGLQFYSFSTALLLFPLQMSVKSHTQGSHPGYNPWKKNQQYLQIASGLSGEYTFVVALEDCQFTEPGHVIQVSVVEWHRYRVPSVLLEHFPTGQIIPNTSVGLIGKGKPFKDWLMDHAKTLAFYPVLEKKYILRFRLDPAWEATTKHFTVQVGVSLDPTLGRWNRGHILLGSALPLLRNGGSYAYYIIIKMHADAPESESCQLMTRHWLIKYASGQEERVDGEGVIGEQPTFTPGHVHQYASCTNFISEEYCTMEGYYGMQYLRKSGTFTIRIPQFYMPLPEVVWA